MVNLVVGESRGRVRSSVWGSIIKTRRDLDRLGIRFLDSFAKKARDGKDTRFWEDSWVGERLKERFNRLFQLEVDKGALVADRGEFFDGRWVWRWSWRREPRGREEGELEELRRLLESASPKRRESDRVVWKLDPQGEFSVKVMRHLIEEKVPSRG